MKVKLLKLALFGFLCAAPAAVYAEAVTITVKGMVCSFCAQGIKKTFGKIADVKQVDVDLEKKLVTLDLKEGSTLSDEQIENTIEDAGYDVLKIERGKGA